MIFITEGEMIYSWSRINTFSMAEQGEGCYYSFYKTYIEGERGEGNYFSEYGSLVHNTIEDINNGILFEWDIKEHLNQKLNQFQYKAPFPAMKKSYEKSLFGFFLVDDFSQYFKDYEILETEEEKIFEVNSHRLRGYPDLVAQHKKYGLVILDFKTSKPYKGEKLEHNIMQLYLYAIPIKEKYGMYPDHLIYFYPREPEQKEYVYDFDLKKLDETKQFITNTIEQIRKQKEFPARCEEVDGFKDFFVCNLCNHRQNCNYRMSFKNKYNHNN